MKKYVLKITLSILSVFILIGCLIYFLTYVIVDSTEDTLKKMDTIDSILIGSKVVIKKDTLEIINTNWMNTSVILEDGREYNYKFIEDKFVDPTEKRRIDSLNRK
jgi:hypothetical protein